jgi:serine/threonine protein phosphatase PrpC
MLAIRKGCHRTESDFLAIAYPGPGKPHNKAGSCAIVVFVVNDDVYIINVGDSRAIASVSKYPGQDEMTSGSTVEAHSEIEMLS